MRITFALSKKKMATLITSQDSFRENGVIVERCCARVGFLGNPSDGFKGKTLSFLIDNFAATVSIYPSEGPLSIVEEAAFDDIIELHRQSSLTGYTGGLRLVQATCKRFCHLALDAGISASLLRSRGGLIKFYTTIPRMVGLSGSSAIITATFRALMKLYAISLADLNITFEDFPAVLLSIEQEELGIRAGLQDRVIQAYGGLVHMDFTQRFDSDNEHSNNITTNKNKYTQIDPSLLPPLYLLYNTDAGGDSGAVHSTVRQRYESGDEEVRSTMTKIASLADRAVVCLQTKHYSELADCMEENFRCRRALYGDDVVGHSNIAAAQLAQNLGFSVKFTGSGGSFVCLHRPSIKSGSGGEEVTWLNEMEEEQYRTQLKESCHFALERVQLPNLPTYHLTI